MRPLPEGLFLCAVCGEARGKTPDGRLSVCFCQGVICNYCREPVRRPITDYYDARGGCWWHVPYFYLSAHSARCPAPASRRRGRQFRILPVDDDVKAYTEAMNRFTDAYAAALDDAEAGR